MSKKGIAIDGNSLFYRMYYATEMQMKYAIENNWIPNNGIKLMLSTINKILEKENYDYILIAFDHGEKTFRHELVDSYKTGRSATPDELIKQMNDTIIMLKALGYCVMSKKGIEADDLIGSFANKMNLSNIECDVYTSDKDMLQLVNKYTKVKLLKTGISNIDEFNFDNFNEKFFGLYPNQVIEYKAIIGDKSDNIIGVNGIGQKNGVALLLKYPNLESIYENLETLSENIRNKLVISKEIAFQSRYLATILLDEFKDINIDTFITQDKSDEIIIELINKYKLNSLTFLITNKLF